MSVVLRLLLLTAAFAAGTMALGWVAVPMIGLAWGVMARGQRGAALTAGVAAILGWGALLWREAAAGPVGAVGATLGQLFGVSALAVLVLTLALPGLLGVTAAMVGRAMRP